MLENSNRRTLMYIDSQGKVFVDDFFLYVIILYGQFLELLFLSNGV